ncbi:hypothetical protein A1O3_04795 [Capronia epimyces CBS 606.96]|uniref:Uncharacterized protein n=1 Tax=Capronia epimyces CBS 606.96 TaxID=1182542 RepID=W9XV65_9EURO|nr:uncharacterized protein A1O3_04795 [Capronia epimyces CBS 606.96]EXJ84128.1 hypothetical protein A1O3_04795 [Capronia epimyces CBS 606.96]
MTDPDRIVLGPPRRSFASANARTSGRTQDGSDETLNKDRTTLQEKPWNGDGVESLNQDRRSLQMNGRGSNRHESEDPDLEHRRDQDRKPRWAGRDRNESGIEDEQIQEDSARPTVRRDAHSRAKLSQSWFKKDGPDTQDEARRDADKGQEWRRGEWGRERDWDRSAKVEAEPEWMDSAEPDEPFQVRTQEDFQRWKEKMKAGGAPSVGKPDSAVIVPPSENAQAKSTTTGASPEPDDSMDKFFARYESKTTEQKPVAAKPHGRTRFASLFSPPPEQNKQVEAAPPVPTAERPSSAQPGSAVDADQAGFARILEMLQTRSNNPTPQTQETAKPRAPLYARGGEVKSVAESRPSPQSLLSLLAGQNAPQPQEPTRTRPSASQARVTEPQSSTDQSTHTRQQSSINKDEVLLNLLRQANLAPKPEPPPPHQQADGRNGGAMYGMMSEYNVRIGTARGQMTSPVQPPDHIAQRRETGRAIFEESLVPMYQNEPTQLEQLPGRPANGHRLGLSEDPLMALLRGQNQQPRPMQPPQLPQGLPPGLQRPPGLEQMALANPNWPPQQPQPHPHTQPQQQPLRQPSLPPGLGVNVSRVMPGPPFGQPQQLPSQPTLQQPTQQPRVQQQRKYTGETIPAQSGLASIPPGMYPPPGFLNSGPPPGFTGAMANHPGARYQGEPGPPPQGMPRGGFLDMYGDMGGGRGVGLRGGGVNGGIPPYR